MKTKLFRTLAFAMTFLMVSSMAFSQSTMQEPLSGVENSKDYKSFSLIFMDKELSVFANLVTLSGLNTSLALTDSELTIFAPTNAAFADMTIEKFAELTDPKNKTMLIDFVNRHFIGSKIMSSQLSDSNIIDMEGFKKIKISKSGNTVNVGGANVIKADIESKNGVIHVVDGTLNTSR